MLNLDIHPLCNLFPPMTSEQFNALAEDIKENGQREPIILFEGKILDGRHRYKACINIGVEPQFKEHEGSDPLAFVISQNLSRRHLDESQRAMIAGKIANMKSGENQYSKGGSIEPTSKADAAKKLNVGRASVTRAKTVLNKGTKELVEAVEEGKIAVSVAAKIAELPVEQQERIVEAPNPEQAIKKVIREQKEQYLADRTIHQALMAETDKYGVIYADPPWRFDTYSENGMDRSADNHYPTMSVYDIASLDIPAADDCVLFLWATAPMLPEALQVMDRWGFTYKSQIIWVKDRIGTGYWARNKHEILLIGTKGDIPAPAMGTQPPSVIELPVGKHSEKPYMFGDMIERLFPNTPKVELFSRSPRKGWAAYGNEIETIE